LNKPIRKTENTKKNKLNLCNKNKLILEITSEKKVKFTGSEEFKKQKKKNKKKK